MIVTYLENAREQISMNPGMEKAFRFLQSADLANLPIGKIEIDGKQVFAMIQTYPTRLFDPAAVELEGHIHYIDIQYVVSGHELFGWLDIADVQAREPYDEKKDAWLSTMPSEKINLLRLAARQVAVFYPTDAHAPQLADGEPTLVKKVVIKVAAQSVR
jgi:biofilm protein TabA